MQGLILALLNPVVVSIQNTLAKIGLLRDDIEDMAVVFARLFYVVPVLLVYLLWIGMPTAINPWFWPTIVLMILLEVPSQWFYHQAIKTEQISLVMPLTALLPPFLFTSFVFFGGWSWLGAVGVLVVSLGVYFLEATKYLEATKEKLSLGNLLGPVKAIMKNRASRYMLATVLLWSVTTPLQKVAVGQSNVAFMGVCYLTGCSILIVFQRIIRKQSVAKVVWPVGVSRLIPIGIFAGFGSIFQYSALSFLAPVYVIALKNTILLWSVLWDKVIFHQIVTRAQMISIIIVTIGSIMVGVSII